MDGKQTSVPLDKAVMHTRAKSSSEFNINIIQILNNLENKFPLHNTNK